MKLYLFLQNNLILCSSRGIHNGALSSVNDKAVRSKVTCYIFTSLLLISGY